MYPVQQWLKSQSGGLNKGFLSIKSRGSQIMQSCVAQDKLKNYISMTKMSMANKSGMLMTDDKELFFS